MTADKLNPFEPTKETFQTFAGTLQHRIKPFTQLHFGVPSRSTFRWLVTHTLLKMHAFYFPVIKKVQKENPQKPSEHVSSDFSCSI
jgi:hypothetical protein